MSNPNIKDYAHLGGPKTERGKFLQRAGIYKASKLTPEYRIPQDLRELYEFFKGKNMADVKQLEKLKEMTIIFEQLSIPSMIQRWNNGEVPSKKELDLLKLWKETLVDSHKLEFGDKRVVEHRVTVDDIRKAIMSNEPIIEAEFVEEKLKDNLDNSVLNEKEAVEIITNADAKTENSDNKGGELNEIKEN